MVDDEPMMAAAERAAREQADLRVGIQANMLRYIAFVAAGDEQADAQLAVDQLLTRAEQAEREREDAREQLRLSIIDAAINEAEANDLRAERDRLAAALRAFVAAHEKWATTDTDGYDRLIFIAGEHAEAAAAALRGCADLADADGPTVLP